MMGREYLGGKRRGGDARLGRTLTMKAVAGPPARGKRSGEGEETVF